MSLLDPNQIQANQFSQRIVSQFTQGQSLFSALVAFIWGGTQTPAQALAYFGTNAGSVYTWATAFAAATTSFTGTPLTFTPQGYTVSINADGTVTVNSSAV